MACPRPLQILKFPFVPQKFQNSTEDCERRSWAGLNVVQGPLPDSEISNKGHKSAAGLDDFVRGARMAATARGPLDIGNPLPDLAFEEELRFLASSLVV